MNAMGCVQLSVFQWSQWAVHCTKSHTLLLETNMTLTNKLLVLLPKHMYDASPHLRIK